MRSRTFQASFAALVLVALAARAGYVLAEAGSGPALTAPILDGAIYVEWARDLASGGGGPSGAYYLAPLYPFLLAGVIRLLGENLPVIFGAQQAAVVGTAILLGFVARRAAGEGAALATAAIVVLYHPLLFFASRPMGETVAILALAAGLASCGGTGFGAGLASGVSGLARPNLLLVPVAWAAGRMRGGDWRGAAVLVAGVALALALVVGRNTAVSGRPVGVSTNGGLTFYHGNGPGASGVYTPPEGFSGEPSAQRDEATALARQRSGSPLDPVEADRWWGREAVRTRLADPAGTASLVGKRIALLFDHYEHGLDYAPRLDENPWRHAAPLGFSAVFGLAAVGVSLAGFRGTGGWPVWGAIAATAATPIVFYVSSRYRLPFAALLAVPAGVGAAALVGRGAPHLRALRMRALAIGAACALLSLAIPSGTLARAEEAVSLSNRAIAHQRGGDLVSAERDAKRAVARDPSSVPAQFNFGVILESLGRAAEAETAYRLALAGDPGYAEAAGNLARLLILRGRAAEAVPILRRAVAARPGDAVCWTNLVLALAALGDESAARDALRGAVGAGVDLDPGVAEAIGAPRDGR